MNKTRSIASALLIFNIILLNANSYNAKIKSVTVFLDGAEVHRTQDIALSNGVNKIVLEGLSPSINPKSIRVLLDENIDLLSISCEQDYLFHKAISPEINKINDSIQLIEGKITALSNELKALEAEEDMLQKNQSISGGSSNYNIQALSQAATFFRKRYTEINNLTSKLTQEQTDSKWVLSKLENQLNEFEGKSQYKRSKVTVLISSKKQSATKIGLKYLVTNAGWTPNYDIKALNITEPIELNYKAKVYNETYIDWKDVVLSLSTADPSKSASKPIIKTWELEYTRGRSFLQNSDFGYLSRAYNNTYRDSSNSKDNTQMMIPVENLNANFEIKDLHTIPSSKSPFFVEIGSYSLPATFNHYCAPRVENNAFLIAKVTNWEDINMVTGMANIFFNGAYIGQSLINPTEVSDTMDISLGRDNKVIVQRIKRKEDSSKQLIGNNQKETFAYKTIVKNNRKGAISIEITDQIPVSLDSEIVVEKLNSEGAFYNELMGSLTWNLDISPMQTQATQFSFSIKHPKNKPLKTKRGGMRSIRYF